MPIITWADVNNRYPDSSKYGAATQAEEAYVTPAINELHTRLSSRFTVPFSDNNLTAKDLAIDLTLAKCLRFRDEKKAKSIDEYVTARITALLDGTADMLTNSGTVIQSVGGTVFSTTENYHPVFGMSRPELLVVDSSQIIAEENARGRFY